MRDIGAKRAGSEYMRRLKGRSNWGTKFAANHLFLLLKKTHPSSKSSLRYLLDCCACGGSLSTRMILGLREV